MGLNFSKSEVKSTRYRRGVRADPRPGKRPIRSSRGSADRRRPRREDGPRTAGSRSPREGSPSVLTPESQTEESYLICFVMHLATGVFQTIPSIAHQSSR